MEPTGPHGIFCLHLFLPIQVPLDGRQLSYSLGLITWWKEATRSHPSPAVLPRQGETIVIHPDPAAVPGIPLGFSLSPIQESHVAVSVQDRDPIQHSKHPKQRHNSPNPTGRHGNLIFTMSAKSVSSWRGSSSLRPEFNVCFTQAQSQMEEKQVFSEWVFRESHEQREKE